MAVGHCTTRQSVQKPFGHKRLREFLGPPKHAINQLFWKNTELEFTNTALVDPREKQWAAKHK
jgi:hypothetical protein